jgi:hypothetical protein
LKLFKLVLAFGANVFVSRHRFSDTALTRRFQPFPRKILQA